MSSQTKSDATPQHDGFSSSRGERQELAKNSIVNAARRDEEHCRDRPK